MVLALISIIAYLLLVVFLWSYRPKNVRLSKQQLKAQPTPGAVFEGAVWRWLRFKWNLQTLVDYNSPSNTGGRLTLTTKQLTLSDVHGETIFQLPITENLKIVLYPGLRQQPCIWVYADEKNRYKIRLLIDRNIFNQLGPYSALEQGLKKVRGQGYSS